MSIESEAVRYLGMGRAMPDNETLAIVRSCIEELEATAECKSTFATKPMEIRDDVIFSADLRIKSKSLLRNLNGCSELIFFAATLGLSTDIALRRYIKTDITRAAVFQAAAAAYLEDFCDTENERLKNVFAQENKFLRPRFSPGYGDFPLEIQEQLLELLNSRKTVGIYLTDGNIMLPEKSVTAVIGVSERNTECKTGGCEICGKTNCPYRRN